MMKNIRFGFLLILVAVIANNAVMYINIKESDQSASKMADSERVVAVLRSVFGSLKESETAQREYLLTGKDVYLSRYQSQVPKLLVELSKLEYALAGNDKLQQRYLVLRDRIQQRLEYLRKSLQVYEEQGFEAAQNEIKGSRVESLIGAVGSIADEMEDIALEERRRYQELSDESTQAADRYFALASAMTLLLLGLGFFSLQRYIVSQSSQAVVKTDQAELASLLSGDRSNTDVCRKTLDYLSKKVGAQIGAFYLLDKGDHLKLACSFGGGAQGKFLDQIPKEESLISDVITSREVKVLSNLPANYPPIQSSTGSAKPYNLMLIPIDFENSVLGVIEMGSFSNFSPEKIDLIDQIRSAVGIALQASESRMQIQKSLDIANSYSEKLQAQQEELRVTNEELEEQAEALKLAKERLQEQQEELRQSNEELEQQTQVLEAQKEELSLANQQLLLAKAESERHAADLKRTSQYKSEFLANMSHELRTPLNSLLILATILLENKEGNLTDKQIEFSKTIYKSGHDLLSLINDILDLSKVEAGKLELLVEAVPLSQLVNGLKLEFSPIAKSKDIGFEITLENALPEQVVSDSQRIAQVLRNFLSNALKFTHEGEVRLRVHRPDQEQVKDSSLNANDSICFSVEDTGIGIEKEKHNVIFEAFQQADGSTSRKYGGTGLGLTICKELSTLLGGFLTMESVPNKGSKFHLIIPERLKVLDFEPANRGAEINYRENLDVQNYESGQTLNQSPENFVSLKPSVSPGAERVLLVIEDDLNFAEVIMNIASEMGFDCVHAPTGDAAFEFLEHQQPAAVVLDIRLPDINGLSILEHLKVKPETRHIPVHVISSLDYSKHALQMGAIGYMVKPVEISGLRGAFKTIEDIISKRVRKVLVVEDDQIQRESICALLESEPQTECVAVGDAGSAVDLLKKETFDCMILDLKLPGMSGFDLLQAMNSDDSMARPPVVIYTGKDLSREEEKRLHAYSSTIVLKGARSPERLIDEVSLFLHRINANVSPALREIMRRKYEETQDLQGRKVLIVDDDLRNVFALTSVLEDHGIKVEVGRNGREAIDILKIHTDIDLVLMDIMMPEMDGYEAMQRVRNDLKNDRLPIIALTAKAMKGDEQRCLDAGANDYLAKPIDVGRLISLIKVWTPSQSEVRL